MDKKNSIYKSLGNKISKKRRALGITGQQLANMLGVSQQQVSRYERGICRIDVYLLLQLSDIFNESIYYFISDFYIQKDCNFFEYWQVKLI